MTNIREILREAAGVIHSLEEAEELLGYLLGCGREQFYRMPERELSPEQLTAFSKLIERRLAHEPLAYIVGNRRFFGFDFYVDPRVLIPRSATELLVSKALEVVRLRFHHPYRGCRIAEIGTGSGAVAISLALRLPQAKIYATDISSAALEVARSNCERHKVSNRIRLLQGDMFSPLREKVDILVANLPYVKDSNMEQLSREISFEPILALAGGEDGLDKVRRLFSQARGKLRPGGSLLLEIGGGGLNQAAELAKSYFPEATLELVADVDGIGGVMTIRVLSTG